MPTVVLSPPQIYQSPPLANGLPNAGGKLTTYLAGTSTLANTYQDPLGMTVNANPITLSPTGNAPLYLIQGTAYKYVLTDALGNSVPPGTTDYINYFGAGGTSQTFANGTAAAPSINFTQATTSGFLSPGINQVGIATNGALAVLFDASQNVGIGGTPTTKLDVFGGARIQGSTTISTGNLTVTAGGITATGTSSLTGATTLTGAVTVAGGIFSSRGFTDNATAAAWSLDASGRLVNNGATQTGFAASRSTTQQTSGSTLIFNNKQFDNGTNYSASSGLFVAPIPGFYLFSASAEFTNSTGSNVGIQMRISCSSAGDVASNSGLYATGTTFALSTGVVVKLAAAETVSVTINSTLSSLFVLTTTNYSRFSGTLLG